MKKTYKQIENCLDSELHNMLLENVNGTLTRDGIFEYFKQFLLDANVDSNIIVNVLERSHYSSDGVRHARSIKVNEGW